MPTVANRRYFIRGGLALISTLTFSAAICGECRLQASELAAQIAPLIEAHQGKVAVVVRHLETGESFAVREDQPMPTASLIKAAVMVEAYRQAAAGDISLDEPVSLRDEDKVPGSGVLTDHFSPGLAMPLRDAVHLMIVFSDNTATNLVLDRIGMAATADTMRELGFPNTKIHSKVFRRDTSVFPERSEQFGLGSTTASETARLLELIYRRKVVTPAACEEMLKHLRACRDRTMLARFLPPEAKIAHKTGAVTSSRTAAGVVESPSGAFVVCVLTDDNDDRRWADDNAANVLAAEIARAAYRHFSVDAADEQQAATPSRAPCDFHGAANVLKQAVADGAFPGCTVAAGTSREVLWTTGVGRHDYDDGAEVDSRTIYDLASLTKVIGTTSVVMALVRDGKLSVDDPVAKYVPEFVTAVDDPAEQSRRGAVTVEHLLTHSSGLPAWQAFYTTCQTHDEVLAAVIRTPLTSAPGEAYRYSDLGFMLLGEIAARAGGAPLAELERTLLIEPLGLSDTLRNPPAELIPRIAPTERKGDAEDYVRGVVHDENCRAGEGLTGHAGLFSSVEDLARVAQELLRGLKGASQIFPRPLLQQFVHRRELVEDSSRALGWDTPSGMSSSGSMMHETAFGHTGFTGTSIWIDPERDLFVILLTNRVHPTRQNQKIHAVRRALADAVVKAFDDCAPPRADQ